MSIKRNILYNSILTISNLLIPLLTYPYISRVLGVSNIGQVNFIDSVIDYFLLFSMIGIALTGVREASINKDNQENLDRVFSSLFFLNAVFTLCAIVVLICAVIFVPKLWEYKELMLIGALKLVFNIFLIEWFFQGIEKIKNIMLVSLFIRISYVILLFILVKSESDINVFYGLTSGVVVIKSIFNWFYRKRFVNLRYKYVSFKPYLKSCFSFGLHGLLVSMYTSFNIVFLAFTSGDIEVGYYTSAMKLYGVLIALFSAFTAVLLPRMSSLVSDKNNAEMNRLIYLSFEILLIFSFPVLIIAEFYAPQIIMLLSGPGYEGAITPMRIIIPLLIIVGLEQILIIQILMPLKKDKFVLISSSVGAFVSIIFNIILVKHYGSIGSSIVWLLVELCILIMAIYFVKKTKIFVFSLNLFLKYFVASIPYIIICILVWNIHNLILKFLILGFLSLLYFFYYHICFNKTILVISSYRDLRKILFKNNER